MKLAFLAISAVVWLYNADIGSRNADGFSAIACKKFPVKHKELYHFVTFSGIVDKVYLCNVPIFTRLYNKIGRILSRNIFKPPYSCFDYIRSSIYT